jgi:hypothetical protein
MLLSAEPEARRCCVVGENLRADIERWWPERVCWQVKPGLASAIGAVKEGIRSFACPAIPCPCRYVHT